MAQTLQRTPLHDRHVALGARMVPFAGWEMPVQYSGVIDEVRAVRGRGAGRCGLFDVSHMGEAVVSGPAALAWLNSLTTNDVARLTPGRAQYSLLLRPDGGIIDDGLKDEVRVTVIATGFGGTRRRRRREASVLTDEAGTRPAPPGEGFEVPEDVLEVPSFLREP